MKNPYIILGLNQNATKAEILKARKLAMSKKVYELPEIQIAERQLLDPAKRLAADFLFPSKVKARRIQPIQSTLELKEIDLSSIDENAFDSL